VYERKTPLFPTEAKGQKKDIFGGFVFRVRDGKAQSGDQG
jgi:hypothetical protein